MRSPLLAALLTPLAICPPVAGQAAVSAPPPPAAAVESFQVTLITGDRVRVSRRDGWYDARVEPRSGRAVAVTVQPGRDHAYVIPGDALHLVQRGMLDRRLFDVADLVEQGYDDRHRSTLPLLVSAPPTVRAVPGLRTTRVLPRTGLTAMRVDREDAGRAWSTLRASGTKIWLDAKVRPVLDQSVPQVGAPAAWQSGYTGRGQTVAVLDTGYDPAHPDLVGKVTAARNFSTDPGVQDTNGHGTHVASTIAGSGAASQGRYRGVAPDANLLIGKVLGADGGTESAVLAGMEWAVEQRARVVNMSLGRFDSPGTDPVEAAVDRLSQSTGTLFVVAAGNFGQFGDETISSPASAAAALTVGSVGKTDVLSEFSSRGPVTDTRLVKPELTGPGEDIVAARAAGTLDDVAVGEHYARLNGTSMATPHVAGAAALLAQRHPAWNGEQLKAALVGSAHAIANAGVYEAGAGRLDVARAVDDVVAAGPPSLDLGRLLWPYDQGGTGTRTVAYRNDGAAPVTLDLELAASPPMPPGSVELETERITVPAGGTATAFLRYDLTKAEIGQLGGWLVATGSGHSIRIPFGGYKEPERYTVTANLVGRDGKPVPADIGEVALVDTATRQWYSLRNGETLRLPPGVYGATGIVLTPRPNEIAPALTLLGKRHFTVNADTTISFDARTARRLAVDLDPADDRSSVLVLGSSHQTDVGRPGHLEIGSQDDYLDEVYLGGYEDRDPNQVMYFRESRIATDARLTVEAPERFEVPVWWASHSMRIDGTLRLGLVDGGLGRPEDLAGKDVRGKAVLITPEEGAESGERVAAVAAAGGRAVVIRLRARVWMPETETAIPVVYSHRGAADRLLAAGRITLRLARNTPYVYDIARPLLTRLPDVLRPRDHELAAIHTEFPDALGANTRGYFCPEAFYGVHMIQVGGCAGGVALPSRQTVHYTPDPVEYRDLYNLGAGKADHPLHLETGVRVFAAGSRSRTTWGGPVFGPGLRDIGERPWAPPLAHRADGAVQVAIPLLADGDGHQNWIFDQEFGTGTTTLHRDGVLVGASEQAGVGRFEIPAGPADLKLATRFQRAEPSWPLSTAVSATWFVRSDGDGVLPLMAIRYRPRVGPDGSAPGNTAYELPVRVERERGTPDVRRLTVKASYDDGQTWRTVPVHRTSDGWRALLTHPATGYVSLQASATDADGNKVEQMIVRAYALR